MRKIILYVPNILPGGAEKVFVNLANYLSRNNNTSVYLMTRYGSIYDSLIEKTVIPIETKGRSLFQLLLILYHIKPDIILSTMASANVRLIFFKCFLKTKTLYITRAPAICLNWKSYKTLKTKILYYFGNYAYRFSDYVIANSPDTTKSLIVQCKVSPLKIFTIGNPVLYKDQINVDTSDKINKKSLNYILAVGSFKPVKRYDLMLDMFKILSESTDLNLYIVGGGQLEIFIKNRIKELDLEGRVKLLGIKDNLVPYYRNAKCFVHCAELEGFGNVIVEALAQGTVPICFNCPGGPSYILDNNKYGILVPFGNIDMMAEAIYDVIIGNKSFDKSTLVSRACYFSVENKASEYFHLFKKLYKNKFREDFFNE